MTLQRVVFRSFGRPCEVVELEEIPPKPLAPGEARVAVRAAPINPADELLLSGRHAFRPALPATVGIEGAGEVIEVAPGISGVAPGDLVVLPPGGTWCSEVTCPADKLYPMPPGLDPAQAAMLSVNAVTARCLVSLLPGAQPGDWILQNAASSAVGHLVARLARASGLRTVNVIRSAAAEVSLREAGGDVVLVGDEDLARRVREATEGAAIRLALDAVAGEASGRLASALAPGGTLVIYGLLSSDKVELPAAAIVFERVLIRGFSRLSALAAMGQERARALHRELGELALRGEISSRVEARYPLAQIREALAHAERGGRQGKILLEP
jgi:trans-2-enoyl-CoA reductase